MNERGGRPSIRCTVSVRNPSVSARMSRSPSTSASARRAVRIAGTRRVLRCRYRAHVDVQADRRQGARSARPVERARQRFENALTAELTHAERKHLISALTKINRSAAELSER